MNRRDFMTMMASGALAAMLVPSVATALASGTMTPDELYERVKDKGLSTEGVFLTQESKVVGRMLRPANAGSTLLFKEIKHNHEYCGARTVTKTQDRIELYQYGPKVHLSTNWPGYTAQLLHSGKHGNNSRTGTHIPTHDRIADGETQVATYAVTSAPYEVEDEMRDYVQGRFQTPDGDWDYPIVKRKRSELVHVGPGQTVERRVVQFVNGTHVKTDKA